MSGKENWRWWHTFFLFCDVAAMLGAGLLFIPRYRIVAWLLNLVLLLVFCLIVGKGITGLYRGLFIDWGNMISLSRLQLISWTIIVLSGFLTAAFSNFLAGSNDPLAIAIPEQLWMLMGISTTSLVGSPLIGSVNLNREPNPKVLTKHIERMKQIGATDPNPFTIGSAICYKNPEDSRWANIFESEAVGGAPLDLGKIQMFYFTLILISVYLVNLGLLFRSDQDIISGFPALSSSMIALLAISHAGFLTDKAVPRS